MWLLRAEISNKPPESMEDVCRIPNLGTRYSRFETKEEAESCLEKLKQTHNVYNEEISEIHGEE